jgi:exopolysaccharide biosynthesis protein
MKKIYLLLIISVSFLFFSYSDVRAGTLSKMLSGRILIDVERNGEAWYIYPIDNKRYYLGRPHDAFDIMRNLGLGISENDFKKIPLLEDDQNEPSDLVRRLAGRIVLQVEKNGEAWYINPLNHRKYYLGRPDDAFGIMRELGLGISRKNLASISKNTTSESINRYSSYYHRMPININNQNYFIDMVRIDLNNPNLKIITDTANSEDCPGRCPARPLIDYVVENNAFAAINGSYFNTSAEKLNYYFFPVYNSRLEKMINSGQLRYPTTGPIIVFDQNNNFYYFKDSREFASVDNFERMYNTKIQAAIGNKPRLLENGKILLIDWELDDSQINIKATRGAIAYKGEADGKGQIYFIIARLVTVVDLADIVKSLNFDYAVNLDGGYSTALFYNDEYMMGPGRNIPNAILFAEN